MVVLGTFVLVFASTGCGGIPTDFVSLPSPEDPRDHWMISDSLEEFRGIIGQPEDPWGSDYEVIAYVPAADIFGRDDVVTWIRGRGEMMVDQRPAPLELGRGEFDMSARLNLPRFRGHADLLILQDRKFRLLAPESVPAALPEGAPFLPMLMGQEPVKGARGTGFVILWRPRGWNTRMKEEGPGAPRRLSRRVPLLH